LMELLFNFQAGGINTSVFIPIS
jgi:hypothetical protein